MYSWLTSKGIVPGLLFWKQLNWLGHETLSLKFWNGQTFTFGTANSIWSMSLLCSKQLQNISSIRSQDFWLITKTVNSMCQLRFLFSKTQVQMAKPIGKSMIFIFKSKVNCVTWFLLTVRGHNPKSHDFHLPAPFIFLFSQKIKLL